jgi:hypothetical protein
MPSLSAKIEATLGASDWQLEIHPDIPDGQCLLFHYPCAFSAESPGYVRPVVKIELGARSDDWPTKIKIFNLILTNAFLHSALMRPFLFEYSASNVRFGKRLVFSTRKRFGQWMEANQENSVWPGTTTICGVC